MNVTEAAFMADNLLFGGLANYLDKKDLLQDFAEKIANLEIMKRARLEEYLRVFDELKAVHDKRSTLMHLYLKIARCVYFSACLSHRLQELYSAVTPEFFRNNETPAEAHQVFRALHYLLTGEEAEWPAIQEWLRSEELIPRLVALQAGKVADERSAFLKENYLTDPHFKANVSGLPSAFSFVRVLSEWTVAQVLFKDYPAQMKEIDELILKVNDERSNLENDETELRDKILDIASHMDSLRLRLVQLQEDVHLAVREEHARESIAGHLHNGFELADSDISEILTGHLGREETSGLQIPSLIEAASWVAFQKPSMPLKESGSVDEKLPTTFKLDTPASHAPEEDSPTFRSISDGSRDKPSQASKAKCRQSNDATSLNQQLHDELEQMKKALLDDYNRKKSQPEDVGSGNIEDYYLKFIAGGGEAKNEDEGSPTRKFTTKRHSSFLADFEKIDVLSVSDNLSVYKLQKSPDSSQVFGKNFLLETGFSRFDALIKKGATGNMGTGNLRTGTISSKNTIHMTPQGSNNKHFNDFTVLMTSSVDNKIGNISDNAILTETVRKINDKVTLELPFHDPFEREVPCGTRKINKSEIQSPSAGSALTYGRSSSLSVSDFQGDFAFTIEPKEIPKAQFTSFKGPSQIEIKQYLPVDTKLRSSNRPPQGHATTPRLAHGEELPEFSGITSEKISQALEKHRMHKKKHLDLSGIIDEYIHWKFEDFCHQNFRFPQLPFFQSLGSVPGVSISTRDYHTESQLMLGGSKKRCRNFFDFKVIAISPIRKPVSGLSGFSSHLFRRDRSPSNPQFILNESTRISHLTGARTSPDSAINQSLLTRSIWETPISKRATFKQLAGNQKLPNVIFQNAIDKNDFRPRNNANSSEAMIEVGPAHSPFGSAIKFVNAPIVSFHKSPQTPNFKSNGVYLTPTVKGQPVGELWPEIFDHPSTSKVPQSPFKVVRNSFSEIVIDSPDPGAIKNFSPRAAQIRDSRSTAAANNRSMGDRSPAMVIVNGPEAWLVKNDKDSAVYRCH